MVFLDAVDQPHEKRGGNIVASSGLAGKATCGFVSKYQKGANVPTGQTEFQFRVVDLNFRSTSKEWLVIAEAKAQYECCGTINGKGGHFMFTDIDGAIPGDWPGQQHTWWDFCNDVE